MTDAQAYSVAGGIVGGAMVGIVLLGIAFYVLLVIAEWKIFTKAGEAGWKSLIPIYSSYIMYKIVGMKMWFWVLFAASMVFSILSSVMPKGNQLVGILAIILLIFTIIITIMQIVRIAKSFGKGVGYIIGLIFLPNIFTLILGFGSAKYEKIYND